MSFFNELKRRNVFKVAIAYVVVTWLVLQVADVMIDNIGAPDWLFSSILLVLGIGFPVALVFAWAFELTPEGIKRENEVDRSRSIAPKTGSKIDRAIIAVLTLALGYFAWQHFSVRPDPAGDPATGAAVSGPDTKASAESPSPLPNDKSIAVLPFENRSQREEDEYFSSGIHDDLLTQLAQINSLRVISRTSVAQFKDTTLAIRDIAKVLGVATILEGGVQRAGNQVRINMQLIDAATDTHLWAQTYDRELTANNIFAIQSEIAGAVTNAMRVTLTPDEQQRISGVPTENMAALDLYFKGRIEMDRRTLPGLESARLRFEEARRLDPGFALAWASEAQAILLLSDSWGSYGEIPREDATALARPLVEEAYRLAPNDAQVLAVYGFLEQDQRNIDLALDYYRRSLLINPSSGEVLNWLSIAQMQRGLRRESLATKARMVEADPMSLVVLFSTSVAFVNTPYDDGTRVEKLLDRLEGLDKSYGLAARAQVFRERGRIVEAVRHYYGVLELDPGRSAPRSSLGRILRSLGLVEEALLVDPRMDEFEAAWSRSDGEEVIRLARARHADSPSSRTRYHLMFALAIFSDAPEEAMPLAREVFSEWQNNPVQNFQFLLEMAWVADMLEYPAEAEQWRDIGAAALQNTIEAGFDRSRVETSKFLLAQLDGRKEDAFEAMARAIDLGARMSWIGESRQYATFRDDPQYQALVNRMLDTIASEREQVVAMLCGPDPIVTTWQPAPETCADEPTKSP